MRKTLTTVLFVAASSLVAVAQSGTNSPYSQYGLGTLGEQSGGFNRGMNGLGIAFSEHNQVNCLNPASYASIDSLSFIFDAGVSGLITNYSESGVKVNAKNANFEYVIAGFHAAKNLGVSFGLLPYSNIGYSYSETKALNATDGSESTVYGSNTYSGSGGLHQVYVGAGWSPIKGLAVGVNVAYLWGDYTRSVVNSYTDAYVNTLSKYYTANVHSYKLDFGVQYTQKLTKQDVLTLGVTYSLGHKLGADAKCQIVSTNAQTAISNDTTHTVANGLEIPHTFGIGLMWNRANRWRVGVDYTLQKWSSIAFPSFNTSTNSYKLVSNQFSDRHKLTMGGEFCPEERSRKFFKRIHYRMGASYATDYLKIKGQNGPKEYSISAGFGIPIVNGYNNRSLLNISAQWVCQDSKTFVTENSFRINIGLTFNERWFAKWKME